MQLELADLLRRARGRLATPATWTRGAFARDAAGLPVAATSPQARSWCVAGALLVEGQPLPSALEQRAGRDLPRAILELERRPLADRASDVLRRAFALLDDAAPGPAPRLSPAAWLNNTAGHEEVLVMLDRAIRRAAAA